MRIELRELQHRLGITSVYVTHDLEEALAMSDRIVVMRDGLIEQTGTPDEIYGCRTAPLSRISSVRPTSFAAAIAPISTPAV